ncbi:hypothetical protein HU200_020509 [Digitaria exilis]|uniref:Cathepsin propeptide inhibitor domain-containing protein n=1 Tax=Digitaria exilis TaxID=1010633 RepID=A0A835F241_9POAL|nr:hypothetical protein HU200_020509 [Digitaria exilis]
MQRHLSVGDGAYVSIAVAALTGLVGTLYFVKNRDESAGDVTRKEAWKTEEAKNTGEETRKKMDMEEASVKEDNDNDFSLEKYLIEMTELAAAQKKARYEREMSGKKAAVKEVANSEAMTDEDMKEEAAMKARFEEWMKEHGRRYKDKEEKAQRYELFKDFAKMVDKANAQGGGAMFVTNHTADWTEEECQCLYDGDVDWDDYLDHIQSLIDKKNAKAKKAISE